MQRTILAVLLAFAAGTTVADVAVAERRDPADPKALAPARPYESAFKDYRPYVVPDIVRWREVNEEVGRLNGHVGHVPRQSGTAAKPGAKPPAPGGHGAHK